MEEIRNKLAKANELITETIDELQEISPMEFDTIETLKEKRIEIWGIIQEIDVKTTL